MSAPMDALQERLGYRFRDQGLLERALTHPSWLQDHPAASGNNQRLEFLGDSVLQLLLSKALYDLHPGDREGELTKRRSILGRGAFLAVLAKEVGINACLRMGSNEESTGGREKEAALEDAFEAVVGAVELDGGMDAARSVVMRVYGDLGIRLASMQEAANPKGRLQEVVQPLHGNHALRYETLAVIGADHERTYEVAVYLQERRIGVGRGPSKKTAEEEAAREGLAVLAAGPLGG